MAKDKAQYIVALIAEFAAHFGLTTGSTATCTPSRLRPTCATSLPIAVEWEARYDDALSRFQRAHRDETQVPPYMHSFDVVYGPIANDRVGLPD